MYGSTRDTKKASYYQWTSLTFIVPKSSGTVHMILDFRKLNTNFIQKLYPIPKNLLLCRNWKDLGM